MEVMVTVTNPQHDEAILNSEVTTVPTGEMVTVSGKIPRHEGHLVTVDVQDDSPSAQFRWKTVDEPLHVIIHPREIVFTLEPE